MPKYLTDQEMLQELNNAMWEQEVKKVTNTVTVVSTRSGVSWVLEDTVSRLVEN
jgi:hypothetical protein